MAEIDYFEYATDAAAQAAYVSSNPDTTDTNIKLLVHCDGTDGATTFTDSSASGQTLTAAGTAKVQSPSTIDTSGSALFLDGTSGTYVSVPDSTDWDLGANYTIECFVRFSTLNNPSSIIGQYVSGGNYWNLYYYNGAIRMATAGTDRVTYTITPTLNVWYHIAIACNADTGTIYINGSAGTPSTGCTISSTYAAALTIGSLGASNYLNGWIKEVRISNVARTITVPTTPYTTDANTKLLLHFDNSHLLTPCCKFNGAAYLSLADSADWTFAGNFTIEAYVRMTTLSGSQTIFEHGSNDSNYASLYWDSSQWRFNVCVSNAPQVDCTAVETPPLNSWMHICIVRNGTDWRIYRDGVSKGYTTSSYTYPNYSQTLEIGGTTYGGALSARAFLSGFLKEYRISNVARYTAAFAPPTTAFTADSNTILQIHFNEANGATTFTDSETTPKTITNVANAIMSYEENYLHRQITDSETTAKYPVCAGLAKVDGLAYFGTGCLWLDGNSDNLSSADHADWDFGTGEWTLSLWARWSTLQDSAFIDRNTTQDFTFYYINSDTTLRLCIGNSDKASKTWTSPVVNTWYHLVCVRSSGKIRIFVNGTQIGTDVSDTTDVTYAHDLYIGSYANGSNFMCGLLDDIVIDKGAALYTATFNPPSTAYTTLIPGSLNDYSEATIKSQGSYALKGVATTGAINQTLTRTIT